MRLLSLLALLAGLGPLSPSLAPFDLDPVARLTLHGNLGLLADVRFDGEDKLLFAARDYGVALASYDRKTVGPPQLLLPEDRNQGIVFAQYLGSSSRYLAVASTLSQMIWWERGRTDRYAVLGTWGPSGEAPISFFEDIDVQDDRMAVLGAMRAEHGMSPDGAIAWTARLSDPKPKLKAVAYSAAGAGARPFSACATFSIGKLRFLADGSLLILKGAEPGVFLFSSEGKLLRTWDTRRLGLDIRCDFDDATMIRFGSDVEARLEYINRFVTVDEILPTAPDPSLVLRWVEGKETHWKLAFLHSDGSTSEMALPIVYGSPRIHLRGDVRTDRLVLTTQEFLQDEGTEHSELLEFRFRRQAPAARARN